MSFIFCQGIIVREVEFVLVARGYLGGRQNQGSVGRRARFLTLQPFMTVMLVNEDIVCASEC